MMYCNSKIGEWRECDQSSERAWKDLARFALICTPVDMAELQHIFSFDESTVRNCMDLDESVRFASYPDYDFISLLHTVEEYGRLRVSELNLYLSSRFLILVAPAFPSARVRTLIEAYRTEVARMHTRDDQWLNRAHYALWNLLLQDTSEALEALEDNMEALQDRILSNVEKGQIDELARYHKVSYAMKKHMRAMADVGEAMLVNNNGLLLRGSMRHFQSIAGRLNRMRDAATSLYESSNYLQATFDSRMQGKMNEAVNKLTFVTIIFAPLTLITGVYGMNFLHMPELHWLFGYPLAILLMMAISALIFFVFKRNEWL